MQLRKMLKVEIRLPGGKTYHGKPMAQAILETCRKESIIGATVVRCLFGYGDTEYKPRSIVGLKDLPLIVEIVDEPVAIKAVLPDIKHIVGDNGLITIEEVVAL